MWPLSQNIVIGESHQLTGEVNCIQKYNVKLETTPYLDGMGTIQTTQQVYYKARRQKLLIIIRIYNNQNEVTIDLKIHRDNSGKPVLHIAISFSTANWPTWS